MTQTEPSRRLRVVSLILGMPGLLALLPGCFIVFPPSDLCETLVCSDDNLCTDDACADGACVFENNSAECDDGVACTENDVCLEGTCTGATLDCDDGDFCTGVETCDSATGCVDGDDPCDSDTETCDEGRDACVSNPVVPAGYVLRQVATGLNRPSAIFLDSQDRLLVTELGLSSLDNPGLADGVVSQLETDGTHSVVSAGFYDPHGLVVDQFGNLFVADSGPTHATGDFDGLIWKDSGAGPTVLSTGLFTTPADILIDALSPETLLVSDVGGSVSSPGDTQILRVDAVTGATSTFFDDGTGGLINIGGIAADSIGRIYAADNGTTPPNVFRIESVTSVIAAVISPPFVTPQKIRFNSEGDLFVPDSDTNTIYVTRAGTRTAEPFITNVASVRGLLIDGSDVYFTEAETAVWVASPSQ